jgi:hypothetical protein
VLRACAGRKHPIAVENKVICLVECDRMNSGEVHLPGSANCGDRGFNCGGIDRCRFVSGKTEQNGAIRRMALPCKSERSVKIGLHASHTGKKRRRKFPCEPGRSSHGPHGVRT